MRFTLKELAHFDRCLYPDELIEALSSLNIYDEGDLIYFKMIFRSKAPLHIIKLYQEFIRDEKMCRALEIIVNLFVSKHKE